MQAFIHDPAVIRFTVKIPDGTPLIESWVDPGIRFDIEEKKTNRAPIRPFRNLIDVQIEFFGLRTCSVKGKVVLVLN
jgi:hypothetical protein